MQWLSFPIIISSFLPSRESERVLNRIYFFLWIFKVETSSDSCLVVSGLPERNGNKHAGHIARMSLRLVTYLKEFKISHLPGRTLQFRIGIHSGENVSSYTIELVPHLSPRSRVETEVLRRVRLRVRDNREIKQQRQRRLRKRHLNSEFALPRTLSRLFWNWVLKDCQVEEKKNKAVVLCSRPRQNVKLGTFTS